MHKPLPWIGQQAPKAKVAVIGDLILDEYLDGQVTRISPEAPVPVHLVSQTIQRPGGAANAALNITRAGGEAVLIGICGDDAAGKDLKSLLAEQGVSTKQLMIEADRPTTRKTRISSGRQQIVRVDWERSLPINSALEARLFDALKKQTGVAAVLVSDYGKGVLTPSFIKNIVKHCNSMNIKVIIDPKGNDYEKYRDAYLITPNRKEAMQALGFESDATFDKEAVAAELQVKFGIKNILLTLGADGMYLRPSDEATVYLPATAREVFDVSGAGDTVAAIVSLAIASGCPLSKGIEIANLAAAIVVGKWGTQPVEQHELQAAVDGEVGDDRSILSSRKIKSLNDLKYLLGAPNARSRKLVFTNGCFDILHAGHVTYLEKARSLGDALVVAINDDDSVKRLKGSSRPIISCEHRAYLLAALSCVDYVVIFTEDTPLKVIEALTPNVLVKGADYALKDIVGGAHVVEHGGVVTTIELVPGLSTSEIIKRTKG
jgi:D-beta-D-heptose 7-phosphate kinase/D-beta-D-heptose 1-phosphate adenosyltransferase